MRKMFLESQKKLDKSRMTKIILNWLDKGRALQSTNWGYLLLGLEKQIKLSWKANQ